MPKRHISDNENSLVILLMVKQLSPLTGLELCRYCFTEDQMDYITMQLTLSQLETDGLVYQRTHPFGSMYALTSNGEKTLALFESRIPLSRREAITASADKWKSYFKREQLAPTAVIPLKDGESCLQLQLLEKDAVMLDIRYQWHDAVPPTLLGERWQQAAGDIYGTLIASVDMETEMQTAEPVQLGDNSWMVTLSDAEQHLIVHAVFPDRAIAAGCAAGWSRAEKQISDKLQQILTCPFEPQTV